MPNGHRLDLHVRRLVSFTRPELAAISYSFCLPDGPAEVRVISGFNTNVQNLAAGLDPRVGSKLALDALRLQESHTSFVPDGNGGTVCALMVAQKSAMQQICAAQTVCSTPASGKALLSCRHENTNGCFDLIFEGHVDAGCVVTMSKYLAYSNPDSSNKKHVCEAIEDLLDEASAIGFDQLAKKQAEWLAKFWKNADIVIEGDSSIQQAIRFNLFHLLQSAGRDGVTNLAAKGLSGEGYEGHYFWDTEVYALPVFTHIEPKIARALLNFRSATLDQARMRAKELDHAGALYPWRTINGHEASAYYEAGTAQYHINADIIHAGRRYALASGDEEFLKGPLARMSVETARFWYDLGDFVDRSDGTTVGDLERRPRGAKAPRLAEAVRSVFCINTVTGPDEYSALVNNNIYTNLMAAMNLQWAADLINWLTNTDPDAMKLLAAELRIKADETDDWLRAADAMFIPWDSVSQLYPQDESFFHKAPWFVDQPPLARRPLLLHYHPLVIYRYQVLKQPDLVLAQFLRSELFTASELCRNFEYYEPLTTGDSSLSHCIQSIVSAGIGKTDKAWNYFCKTVRMDLDDLHGNVHDGIHTASMAGGWMSLVHGFAGFRERYIRDNPQGFLPQQLEWSFAPSLPNQLTRLCFFMTRGNAVLEVDLKLQRNNGNGKGALSTGYRLCQGEELSFWHREEHVVLQGRNADRQFVEVCHV